MRAGMVTYVDLHHSMEARGDGVSAGLDTDDYAAWLHDLKASVRQAQGRVARPAHREMICVY